MKAKGLSEIEQKAIKEFSSRLRDKFPREIKSLFLYGSKARGSSHAESDIDVLVLVNKRMPEIDEALIDVVCDVLNEYGVFIETVTMSSIEYKNAVSLQYPFALNVERDAIRI